MRTPKLRQRGITEREIARLRATHQRVRRGFYTAATDDAWTVYRLRCIAVATSISGAVLAGPSAALMLGLHLVDDPPDKVFIRGVPRGRYGSDVRVVSGAIADTTEVDGLAVTSAAWTVADCARLLPRRDALIVADNALHMQVCSPSDLSGVVVRLAGTRGIERVRWVIRNADGRSESPGETWLRMILEEADIAVDLQVWIDPFRVDLIVAGTRVILEFDGLVKYDDSHPGKVAAAIKAERGRQAALEAVGYLVLRFIWDQLADPDAVLTRVRQAIGGNPARAAG